jgi:hypothetical protein
MHKTTFAAIAVGALIVAVAGLVTRSNRPLQAKTSTAIESQIDTFRMMASAEALPTQEFQDFSFVFSEPVAEGRNSAPLILADKVIE